MNKFLRHILLGLGVLLVVNLLYVVVVGGNLRSYEKKYLDCPEQFRLLVLGDSHANRSWAGNTDAGRYNFAQGSDNITDMMMKLEYAIQHNKAEGKKAVVLPFEPHLVSVYREEKQNNTVNKTINSPYLNKHLVYWLPLFFDANTGFDTKRYVLQLGKKPADPEKDTFTKGRARSRAAAQFPDSTVSRKLLREYQALITRARQAGYDIIPVRYPVHPYYDSLVRSRPESAYLTTVVDSLAKANGLTVRDFTPELQDESWYVDQDHLNKKGAAVFMEKFAEVFHY
jgi:hypothetical protein